MKYWEIIAERLSQLGWSWGCSSHIDTNGREWFVVDAKCEDGKQHIVRADEMLSAFLELERQLVPRIG
jgi:hypothetical protein